MSTMRVNAGAFSRKKFRLARLDVTKCFA